MKYSVNKILIKCSQFEYLASSNLKIKRASALAVARGLGMFLIPTITQVARNRTMTPDSLKDGINQLISELNDLDKTVNNEVWTDIYKTLGNVLLGAGAGASTAAMVGAAGGSFTIPIIGTIGGAGLGALVGGILGAGKGASDIYQLRKLAKNLPKLKEIYDPLKEDLLKISSALNNVRVVSDKFLNTDKKDEAAVQSGYENLVNSINEYDNLLRKIQLRSTKVADEIETIKTGFTEFAETLTSYGLGITSDLRDVQDALAKLQPELSKATFEVESVKDSMNNAEKNLSNRSQLELEKTNKDDYENETSIEFESETRDESEESESEEYESRSEPIGSNLSW